MTQDHARLGAALGGISGILVTPFDDEYRRPFCRGVVVREMARRRSNWRATEASPAYSARAAASTAPTWSSIGSPPITPS